MIDILINDSIDIPDITAGLISVGENALHIAAPELICNLTVSLTSDEEIQMLNAQFRKIDRPTDVLSFESDEFDPETGVRYLGDIVISFQRARQQALDAGHPVENEIKLLLVHGILHLLGYDHDTPQKKAIMWKLQEQILKQNHVSLNKISGDEEDE